MKTAFSLFSFFFLLATAVNGQTFDEWFRQKRTKEKYLVQQIAALQAYSGTLRKGYAIAREGISAVRYIKNGDLGLHQVFFRSLGQVNPLFRHAPHVQDILERQAVIRFRLETYERLLTPHNFLTPAEQAYLQQVKATVLNACRQELDRLWLILTDNSLEMTDGRRLEQLQALYARSAATYAFTFTFLSQVRQLALQRAKETQQISQIQHLYFNP